MIDIGEIIEKLDVKVISVIPQEGFFIIVTSFENYTLKRTKLKEEELIFVHGAKEYMIKREFSYIDRYCINHNNPYIKYDNNLYTLTKNIDGRICRYNKFTEVKAAMKLLAEFHMASKGYVPEMKIKSTIHQENQHRKMIKKSEDFIYISNLIKMKTKRNRIDELVLNIIDRFNTMGVDAVQKLQDSDYSLQADKEIEERQLCHSRFNYSNIIIDKNYDLHLINLENCKYGLRLLDIVDFMAPTMDIYCWNFQLAKEMLSEYNRICHLTKPELMIIGALLQFPQKFWSLSTMYYYEKYPWAEKIYYYSLRDIAKKLPYRIKFFESFYSELT